MTLSDATLLEILESMARQYPALCWTISYGPGPHAVGLESAIIVLSMPGGSLTASSSRSQAERERLRTRLMVPILSNFSGTLVLYLQRARQLAGIELLHEVENASHRPTGSWLDLTGVAPAEAVARIVALDSRYEWHDAGGIVNVRPRPDLADRNSLLEHRLASFSVDGDVKHVLASLQTALGGHDGGSGSGQGGVIGLAPDEQARRIAAGRAKIITLQLDDVTFRDALNAICRAHGSLSWSVQPLGVTKDGRRRYTIQFDSVDGWHESRTIALTQ